MVVSISNASVELARLRNLHLLMGWLAGNESKAFVDVLTTKSASRTTFSIGKGSGDSD
jgi:hypothetical protein